LTSGALLHDQPIGRMVCTHLTRKIPRGIHGESGDIDCCVTFQGKADLRSHVGQRANEDDRLGLIKIVARSNGPILGASIVGEGAVETITEIAIAMRNMLKLADLTATNKPYPTYSTGVQLLAT
jgi:hypothetical protein